ncbi:MAG: bifunctional UDP-N-acetylglucosamine diphosphorylase/glucosamine-1-phosphate N-acetyltransferase GlmU, partial [Nitrospiraceae bacterium]
MNQSPNQPINQSPIKGLGAIVMAAGLGKRMRSKLVKVLHPVADRPMVLYGVELAERLASEGVAVVVGHQGDQVKALIEARGASAAGTSRTFVVEQKEQLGTGHAVMQARTVFARECGGPAERYVILNGDTPLLKESTVRNLVRLHETEGATVTLLTAVLEDPTGYGRVVRKQAGGRGGRQGGMVLRIVENCDATDTESRIQEINVGTYVVDGPFLFEALERLKPQNAQKEYYLTDIVALAVKRGFRVAAMATREAEEGLGINTREQLATAERVVRQQLCARWMQAGVTLQDPATTWIDADVKIGQDTVLHPHVTLEGQTIIGEGCVIRSHTRISDSRLGHRVAVHDCCVIRDARL